jgi:tRNA (guanine37-N1)-methyltransferase
VRLLPWALSAESLLEESFSDTLGGQREYPQYSRPEVFENLSVPPILLSGDLRKIQDWKMSQLS